MNINRHNYETYFILYLDNELNSGDRRMVEEFIQQHPDLKEELDVLLQYKLTPDTHIVFEGKDELMKENGHSLITVSNYEEWLSLYIDDELDAEQKLRVEKFMSTRPDAAAELALFRKTKLEPETIDFPGKDSLYRRDEKVRRILPFRWRAAAAILVLLLGTATVAVLNRKPGTTGPAPATAQSSNPDTRPGTISPSIKPLKKEEAGSEDIKNTPVNTPVMAETRQTTHPAPVVPVNNPSAVAMKKTAAPENKITDNNLLPVKKDDAIVEVVSNKPSNNLPLPIHNPNLQTGNKPDDAVALNNTTTNKINPSIDPVVTSPHTQPSDIVPASYQENGETLEQPDGKKNKNRGIFRKIARTFEKRTNIDPTDDNRLLVAGLSIKLK